VPARVITWVITHVWSTIAAPLVPSGSSYTRSARPRPARNRRPGQGLFPACIYRRSSISTSDFDVFWTRISARFSARFGVSDIYPSRYDDRGAIVSGRAGAPIRLSAKASSVRLLIGRRTLSGFTVERFFGRWSDGRPTARRPVDAPDAFSAPIFFLFSGLILGFALNRKAHRCMVDVHVYCTYKEVSYIVDGR